MIQLTWRVYTHTWQGIIRNFEEIVYFHINNGIGDSKTWR